jgi:membrane-associated phospholipid phosphatase
MTTDTTIPDHSAARVHRVRDRKRSALDFPVLDKKPGLFGRRLAVLPGDGHPVWTYVLGIFIAFVSVASLSILAGLVVTRVLLHIHGVTGDDESLVRFLARHRSVGLTDASLVGSIMAGGVVLPIVAGVGAVVAAVASYPSGHTAASIAVYCGLALLLTSRIKNRAAQVAIWIIAVLIPVYVAFSRMYRGMHHPIDIAGGALIGIAALSALVLVTRASGSAAK